MKHLVKDSKMTKTVLKKKPTRSSKRSGKRNSKKPATSQSHQDRWAKIVTRQLCQLVVFEWNALSILHFREQVTVSLLFWSRSSPNHSNLREKFVKDRRYINLGIFNAILSGSCRDPGELGIIVDCLFDLNKIHRRWNATSKRENNWDCWLNRVWMS